VQAVSKGIALNMVQKWLGHAQLTEVDPENWTGC
jgi:hypothetical protein